MSWARVDALTHVFIALNYSVLSSFFFHYIGLSNAKVISKNIKIKLFFELKCQNINV